MKYTVIISAFPACGKTYMCQNTSVYGKYTMLDSDSSNYSWIKDEAGHNTSERNPDFPNNYIKHIKENIGKVDFIFVSSHKVVRDALRENDIKYVLIYPDISLKEEWLRRMRNRGNDSKFLEMMNKNFETFVKECKEEEYPYRYQLGLNHDININKDLLIYFKYLKSENLDALQALKLSDNTNADLLNTNKALLIKIPTKIGSIHEHNNIISALNRIKKLLDPTKIIVVSEDIDFSTLSKETAITIRDRLDKIINEELKED